jgi:hypothetical protein
MTEHDKLALLNMINKTSELMLEVIKSQEEIINANGIKYFKIVSDLHGIIHELIKTAEYNNCKVIWKDYKAVKIVEKEDK